MERAALPRAAAVAPTTSKWVRMLMVGAEPPGGRLTALVQALVCAGEAGARGEERGRTKVASESSDQRRDVPKLPCAPQLCTVTVWSCTWHARRASRQLGGGGWAV